MGLSCRVGEIKSLMEQNLQEIRGKIHELESCDCFVEFKALLLDKNKQLNLTRIVDDSDYSIKNIEDSLLPLFLSEYYNLEALKNSKKFLDLGVGGGFPLFPIVMLAAERGFQTSFTGIDSVQKKIRAIREISMNIGLPVEFVAGRAEELGREQSHRERYNIVVSRAVASLPVLLEYVSPFVKKEGIFVAYKGGDVEAELEQSKRAEKKLSLELAEVLKYSLRDNVGKRTLLVYKKMGFISKTYPRAVGIAKKKPL